MTDLLRTLERELIITISRPISQTMTLVQATRLEKMDSPSPGVGASRSGFAIRS